MSASGSDHTLPNARLDGKALIMIRSGLMYQHIRKLLMLSLHNLLQDSLAIIKELLVFNVR